MKKSFATVAVAIAVLLSGSGADAQSFADVMDVTGCRFSVTSDVGTSKYGTFTEQCRCRNTTCYRTSILTSCGGTYETQMGTTISGKRCCADYDAEPLCLLESSEATAESVKSANSGNLSEVYAPRAPNVVDAYYGYVGTSNRSPNLGRATSIKARLDVCMGSNDVDSAIATNNANTCYNTYCGTSYNEYCNATGNNGGTTEAGAVCHDRCECAINGTGHSTCNQL